MIPGLASLRSSPRCLTLCDYLQVRVMRSNRIGKLRIVLMMKVPLVVVDHQLDSFVDYFEFEFESEEEH